MITFKQNLCRYQPTLPFRHGLAAHNSTYKKLAVQWLNEALCFYSSAVLVDSFMLRNLPQRQAPKR
jgi:hypothetical protein